MNRGYFVTGTNTEVGKTYVTSLLAQACVSVGHTVGVYKPVASGCHREAGALVADDAVSLWEAAGKPNTLADVTPQGFEAAVAPNVAARMEGSSVDRDLLRSGLAKWSKFETVFVEGVGGLMSPVSDRDLVVDLAVDFGAPVILVVGNELGCINSTLLSLSVAEQYGLRIAGVFLNDCYGTRGTHFSDKSTDTNQSELERLTKVSFIRRVEFGAKSIDIEGLL